MALHISNADVDKESFYRAAELESRQTQKRSECFKFDLRLINLNFPKFMVVMDNVSQQHNFFLQNTRRKMFKKKNGKLKLHRV